MRVGCQVLIDLATDASSKDLHTNLPVKRKSDIVQARATALQTPSLLHVASYELGGGCEALFMLPRTLVPY